MNQEEKIEENPLEGPAPVPTHLVDEQTGEAVALPPTNETVEDVATGNFNVFDLSDGELVDYVKGKSEQLQSLREQFTNDINAGKDEFLRRLKARGAKAIPHQEFDIELDPVYTAYVVNLEKLREAAKLLAPEEAAKVVIHVPEFIPDPVPAHDEPGSAVSINALIKRYTVDSEVGKLLSLGLTRDHIDDKLIFKRKPAPKPPRISKGKE
jgi:hypothetical protein